MNKKLLTIVITGMLAVSFQLNASEPLPESSSVAQHPALRANFDRVNAIFEQQVDQYINGAVVVGNSDSDSDSESDRDSEIDRYNEDVIYQIFGRDLDR